MIDLNPLMSRQAELRDREHITVTDDGAHPSRRRFHWCHRRPGTGADGVSRESWASYREAAKAAVDIARCKGLPVDPIVESMAR